MAVHWDTILILLHYVEVSVAIKLQGQEPWISPYVGECRDTKMALSLSLTFFPLYSYRQYYDSDTST